MFTQIMVARNTHVLCLQKLWLQETQMFDAYTHFGYKKQRCLMFTQIMVTRNTNV
jgi:hypothetical protein